MEAVKEVCEETHFLRLWWILEVLEVVLEVRPAPDLHCGESPGSEVVLVAPGWEILLIVLKINY